MGKSKNKLYGIVAVLVIIGLTFRFIVFGELEQTGLLFVGLPALLTIMMIKFPTTPKSAYGITFRVITLFLLMSSILLGEGIVCILFAAPIFYGVAALIIFIKSYLKKQERAKLFTVVIIPFLFVRVATAKIPQV